MAPLSSKTEVGFHATSQALSSGSKKYEVRPPQKASLGSRTILPPASSANSSIGKSDSNTPAVLNTL